MRAFVSLVVLLSVGCSSAPAETSDPEGTAVNATNAPLQRALVEQPCANETAEIADARRALDRVRAMAGLPSLRCDAATAAAAAAHCAYVAANGTFSHVEVNGKPKFYGERFIQRMARAKASDTAAAEVMATLRGADAIEAHGGWMNSVYHRSILLRRELVSFGYGSAESCSTIDFGRNTASVDGAAVVWPPNGATSVPWSFGASDELPNPLPGHDVVGSPISIVGTSSFDHPSAVVTGPSGSVAVKLISPDSDETGLVRAGELHVVPLAPLEPNTRYTATIRARSGDKSVVYATTFTTSH